MEATASEGATISHQTKFDRAMGTAHNVLQAPRNDSKLNYVLPVFPVVNHDDLIDQTSFKKTARDVTQCKKPMRRRTSRSSAASAYFSTSLPAAPDCSSVSHPKPDSQSVDCESAGVGF
jgi:hypothetical protein